MTVLQQVNCHIIRISSKNLADVSNPASPNVCEIPG